MRTKFKLLRVTLALAALAVVSTPPIAKAEQPLGAGVPARWLALTNLPTAVLANIRTNLQTVVQLRANQGVAIFPKFAFTNGNAGTNVQFDWYGSPDGTNYTTSP